LLEAAPVPGLKHRAALSVAYGAGLRGCEVVMLRVSGIDSKRMLIRVEMGKGRKNRHAMLSPQLLELLRAWWLQCRSRGWLVPGSGSTRAHGGTPAQRVPHGGRGGGARQLDHTALRHSFATHLLESKCDVQVILVLFETTTKSCEYAYGGDGHLKSISEKSTDERLHSSRARIAVSTDA
jgi:integrase/recombinase XerD